MTQYFLRLAIDDDVLDDQFYNERFSARILETRGAVSLADLLLDEERGPHISANSDYLWTLIGELKVSAAFRQKLINVVSYHHSTSKGWIVDWVRP